MSTFATRPLVFSTLLHASVAGLLVVVMLRMSRPQPEVPFTIECYSVPQGSSPAPSAEHTAGPVRESSVTFNPVPVLAPVREETVAEPVVDEPVRPRTPARPTTTTAISARTTITEHQRRVAPRTTAPAVPSTSRATSSAHININEVLAAATPAVGEGRGQSAAADSVREASYWEMLLGKLREAHEKPAGLDDGLKTRVEFVLNADGTVGVVRILQSSGNPEFDASVVAAFRRLRDLGAPPAGKVGVNQVTFRTRAD